MFNKLTPKEAKRQKVILFLIIVLCIYIGYELVGIFSHSHVSNDVALEENAPVEKVLPPVQKEEQVKEQPIEKLLNQGNSNSTEMEKLINEYQSLQQKEALLQQKLSIAEAKKRIADLNTKLASLGETSVVDNKSDGSLSVLDLRLLYLDYQDGHWTATVGNIRTNSTFNDLVLGSRIGTDWKIVNIDANGVIVASRDGQKYFIDFNKVKKTSFVPQPKKIVEKKAFHKANLSKKVGYHKNVVKPKTTWSKVAVIKTQAPKVVQETSVQEAPVEQKMDAPKVLTPSAPVVVQATVAATAKPEMHATFTEQDVKESEVQPVTGNEKQKEVTNEQPQADTQVAAADKVDSSSKGEVVPASTSDAKEPLSQDNKEVVTPDQASTVVAQPSAENQKEVQPQTTLDEAVNQPKEEAKPTQATFTERDVTLVNITDDQQQHDAAAQNDSPKEAATLNSDAQNDQKTPAPVATSEQNDDQQEKSLPDQNQTTKTANNDSPSLVLDPSKY